MILTQTKQLPQSATSRMDMKLQNFHFQQGLRQTETAIC